MNPEARKSQFVVLLQQLLRNKCNGVQTRLAEKLEIRTSRISRWLKGQVDPINLETLVFVRIAMLKGSSNEELANSLDLATNNQNSLQKFKLLLEQMLSDKTQEQLAELIGVSQFTISNWLNPESGIEPGKIPVGTMLAIAHQKGWSFDDLLFFLGLQENKKEKKLLINYQSELSLLSLTEKVELLSWLSDTVTEEIKEQKSIKKVVESKNDRKVCVVIEEENIAIASRYTADLLLHLQLKPENITIATPRSLPDSLSVFDVLLLDLNSQQSPCIPLIESLQFDGDVVAFVDRSLPQDIQDRLKDKATEVIVKPVPWSELKRQAYFS